MRASSNLDMEKILKKYPGRLTKAKAIRLYCREMCCAGDMESWKICTFKACFLWRYRLGREIIPDNEKSSKKQRVLPYNFSKNKKLHIISKPENEGMK